MSKQATIEDLAGIVFVFILYCFAYWFVEGVATFFGA